MCVGEWSGSLLAWDQELRGLKDRISGVFGRSELREMASAFLDGLLVHPHSRCSPDVELPWKSGEPFETTRRIRRPP